MKSKFSAYKIFLSLVFSAALVTAVFNIKINAQTEASPTESNTDAALQDLSKIYGQNVTSVTEARRICNLESYISSCAEIGKRYGLYDEEKLGQVDALLLEIKGSVANSIAACGNDRCLLDVAKQLAERVTKKNPKLAASLDLTSKKVIEGEKLAAVAKQFGVDFKLCREMDPDTAPTDLLRSCAKLAKHADVAKQTSKEVKQGVAFIDKTADLRDALSRGELQCGDNTLDGCGNYCLNPDAGTVSQGTSSIPAVCKQIAEKYFGSDGVKTLEDAHRGVSQVNDFYANRVKNVVFTTLDGRTLTSPAEIGKFMEEQGLKGNVEAVEKGMDFMIAQGFIDGKEKEFALKMVRRFKEQGGLTDFAACEQEPGKCAGFVPEEYRDDFEAHKEVEEIMRSEIGFNASECDKGRTDPNIGQKCFEGAKRALPKLEVLAAKNPSIKAIINDIKSHLARGDELLKTESVFQAEGGPGGCKSTEECSAYCSDPSHGPECLAFGAKVNIFKSDEIAGRYREYEGKLRTSQTDAVPVEASRFFRGEGPFPGFRPGETIPGQIPGFTEPGPGFGFPPGRDGLSQECLSAIKLGDFMRAKEICATSFPPTSTSEFKQFSCPSVAVSPCPEGYYREGSRDANGCFIPGECRAISGYQRPQPTDTYLSGGSVNYPVTISGKTYNSGEEALVGCQTNANTLTQAERDTCAAIGRSSFPVKQTICPAMPTVDSCPFGEKKIVSYSSPECGAYYTCVKETDETTTVTGQKEQVWNSLGLRSWIRSDADALRVESLKQACAGVRPESNVWLSGAGDYSSSNFGMPDPEKCRLAAACTSTQYFNGSSCIASGSITACPSGQYWNGTTCVSSTTATTCPSGQYWDGTKCASSTSTQCPSGQYWNGSACVSSTSTNCPSGQYWNGTACINASTTTCPSGQYWDGTKCASSTSSQCPTDQYWNGTSCVSSTTTTTCPSGQYWNGTSCVTSTNTQCPSGQYWNGSACVTTTSTTTCPEGQYWNGSSCISSTNSQCPSGQYWNGSTCASSTSTACPSGQYWNGTSCVSSTSSQCPTDQYWNGTSCVSSTSSQCPSGQYWNGSACVTTTTTTTCPSGQYWNGSSCVAQTTTTCPDGQHWDGSACVVGFSPRNFFARFSRFLSGIIFGAGI